MPLADFIDLITEEEDRMTAPHKIKNILLYWYLGSLTNSDEAKMVELNIDTNQHFAHVIDVQQWFKDRFIKGENGNQKHKEEHQCFETPVKHCTGGDCFITLRVNVDVINRCIREMSAADGRSRQIRSDYCFIFIDFEDGSRIGRRTTEGGISRLLSADLEDCCEYYQHKIESRHCIVREMFDDHIGLRAQDGNMAIASSYREEAVAHLIDVLNKTFATLSPNATDNDSKGQRPVEGLTSANRTLCWRGLLYISLCVNVEAADGRTRPIRDDFCFIVIDSEGGGKTGKGTTESGVSRLFSSDLRWVRSAIARRPPGLEATFGIDQTLPKDWNMSTMDTADSSYKTTSPKLLLKKSPMYITNGADNSIDDFIKTSDTSMTLHLETSSSKEEGGTIRPQTPSCASSRPIASLSVSPAGNDGMHKDVESPSLVKETTQLASSHCDLARAVILVCEQSLNHTHEYLISTANGTSHKELEPIPLHRKYAGGSGS
ncbi:hypothetical protein D6D05_09151 [Aureobasidium pullulans]|nr:hypothetical protein D6D05_09151 [Aureobasidium pullulans]